MKYMHEDDAAKFAKLPVADLRALVEQHGSILSVKRDGCWFFNLFALDRVQHGLPPEPLTGQQRAALLRQAADAFARGTGDSEAPLARVMEETISDSRARLIGELFRNDTPSAGTTDGHGTAGGY